MRVSRFFAVLLVSGAVSACHGNAAQEKGPDPVVFASRVAAYYPGSRFEVVEDFVRDVGGARYRFVKVDRSCESRFLSVPTTILVDLGTGVSCSGVVGRLKDLGDRKGAKELVSELLPRALSENMRVRARVVWEDPPAPSGALLPFWLEMESGYGWYRNTAVVTGDGEYVCIGSLIPFDADPVAWRRELLARSDVVVWDHPVEGAPVVVVEFSDFECPGCRGKWPLIKELLEKFPGKVAHGMVNFPLTTIHPWAFRAASAGWCVAKQDPLALIGLKETFYSMQEEMDTFAVGSVASDYVEAAGLDVAAFKSCYLSVESVDAVLKQMELGHILGVDATPTYFINGYRIQSAKEGWLLEFVSDLIAGKEPR